MAIPSGCRQSFMTAYKDACRSLYGQANGESLTKAQMETYANSSQCGLWDKIALSQMDDQMSNGSDYFNALSGGSNVITKADINGYFDTHG